MRGIVTLAAALALPHNFPYRDLIVLTAFSVVLGTLAIMGLTLGPLLRFLALGDDDPVGQEVAMARDRALQAGLAALGDDQSAVANTVRQEFNVHLGAVNEIAPNLETTRSAHRECHHRAMTAARQAVFTLRDSEEIGDDAFHQMEEELDWLEMSDGGKDNE
jgi:CPA1 family monovalent cation:H+ antiporter